MEKKSLGELCDIVSGGTPARSHTEYWDNGSIPWIKIGNIKGKYVGAADEYITQAGLDGSSAKILPKGTLLYTIFATLGEVGILTINACTNQAIAGILIKNKDEISTDFLYYYLKSKKLYVNKIGRGVAQNNINMSMLRALEVPVPNITEQSQIVSVLDSAASVVTIRQQQLEKLDELVKARFVELFGDPEFNTFGWDTEELGTLCDVGSSKRIYQNEQSQEGIPFWRISDLISKMDIGVADSGLFIPEERYVELKNAGLVPITGDILVTSRGTLGRCYIIKDEDKFYFQDGMISWLSSYVDGITPLYLQYLFTMPGFRKQIDGMQAGSTVAYLSIAMLKKLRVMVPPIETQNCFALFVEQLDKSKLLQFFCFPI